MMKIAIVWTEYVGLSNTILLAQDNEVVTVNIIQEKVDIIPPIVGVEIKYYLANKES